MKKGIVIFLASGVVCLSMVVASLTPYVFPKMYHFPQLPQSEMNPVTEEGAALGRYLFYDPILSRDNTISCASCHRQEVAFSDAGNAFSRGIDDQRQSRNTPSLYNLAYYSSFFWDGRSGSLEDQVLHPVRTHTEMDMTWPEVTLRIRKSAFYRQRFREVFGTSKPDSTHIAKAIAQFERTLLSYNSKYDQVLRGEKRFTSSEYNGFVLVNDQSMADCLHCHPTDGNPLGTSLDFSNNGIDRVRSVEEYKDQGLAQTTGKQEDIGKFKVPSLRNIALTAPYMHDGRFNTLREVIDFYSDSVRLTTNIDRKMHYARYGGVKLTEQEKEDIIAFLHTLTDSTFITDPAFSNPFTQPIPTRE